jgi:broad-specificity NMP kinase
MEINYKTFIEHFKKTKHAKRATKCRKEKVEKIAQSMQINVDENNVNEVMSAILLQIEKERKKAQKNIKKELNSRHN